MLGQQGQRLGEVAGAGEGPGRAVQPGGARRPAERQPAARHTGRRRRARRARRPRRGWGGSRCSGTGCPTGRAGRSRWVRARGQARHPGRWRSLQARCGRTRWPFCDGSVAERSSGGTPALAVVLRGHAADEARRAVAALRPAADGHLALDRVQGVGTAETLGGDDLLAVERGGRHEAGVDRRPLGARALGGAGHHDRAGAALTLGAALLGAGQAVGAEPVERRGARVGAVERAGRAVDRAPCSLNRAG